MTDPLYAPPPESARPTPVLVATGVDRCFDYLAPAGLAAGSWLMVDFAGRRAPGIVWTAEAASVPAPANRALKAVQEVLPLPPLSPAVMQWLDTVARLTLAPRGAVLALTGIAAARRPPRTPAVPVLYQPRLPQLSAAQKLAAEALSRASNAQDARAAPRPVLLEGVTGSGKTEVYFTQIAQVLATDARAQVLVLLPEISLTHQWIARFTEAFGAPPLLWHSRVTPAARTRAWHAVTEGHARVVVGARSALFLPFRQLGLIVVDEEHDASYKQEDGVLYHARDMAVLRAHIERIPVTLASATPSIETLENVQSGKYAHAHLPLRHGSAGLPQVHLVDLRQHPPPRGEFIAPPSRQAMLEALACGEQVLLFINRRGYAPLLLCRSCGHRFQCAHCDAWMVVHGAKRRLVCHHCGTNAAPPAQCPSCQADAQQFVACGPGVERIAQEATELFARRGDNHGPRLVVLSSDAAVDEATWEAITRGEVDVLVGTQMVAKGHHFPRLTTVIVVDADLGLSGADLRAGERTFQLLHQLSGRAGRESLPGAVWLQTYTPEHPVIQALAAGTPQQLLRLERASRQAGGWPPFGQLAALLLDGSQEARVRAAAQQIAQSAPLDARLTVLGPAPATMARRKGMYRYRLLVKATPSINLGSTLAAWVGNQRYPGVRVKIDMNPYSFL